VNRALYASATGMAAEQANLDMIADNLANADVTGFKAATATFASIGGSAHLGTVQTGTHAIFSQGKLERTGGPFDVALDGPGFFAVERNGRRAYTRAGSFARVADGSVQNADGWRLAGVSIPCNATTVRVGVDGAVSVSATTDSTAARAGAMRRLVAGRIRPVTFDAPEGLRSMGSALFVATPASGPPRAIAAGDGRGTKIVFGTLERANVSIVESMMAILTAQRAYEANAKGVQAADEMLRIANNLHRS
jgi:flagellar basal-body rod protein FlgG